MSDQSPNPQNPGGGYQKPYEPPPSHCPDPCDQPPPRWGPPKIREQCCPERECCPGKPRCCNWEDIEDPCIKATSEGCLTEWAKVKCKCDCKEKCCEEWGCGGTYPPPDICVPCDPCKCFLPKDPNSPDDAGEQEEGCGGGGGGGGGDPEIDCNNLDLNAQLIALTKFISSQQGKKAQLEVDLKAKQDREKELRDLIDKFEGIEEAYKTEHHNLVCREDCLKGFHRDVSAFFTANATDLDELKIAINLILCNVERAKCCQKNLDGKVTAVTRLVWKQQQAEAELEKANKAFAIVKDFPKWMDERFKELEELKKQIAANMNDKNREKQLWAFYLFYWKFVPLLCKCFPFPFCCEKKEPEGGYTQAGKPPEPEHLGCDPGDWHPSAIPPERLKGLICCAWDHARRKKQKAQDATDAVETAKRNLDLIKKRVEEDVKGLEKKLKDEIKKVISS
jgi:hypothetical protein